CAHFLGQQNALTHAAENQHAIESYIRPAAAQTHCARVIEAAIVQERRWRGRVNRTDSEFHEKPPYCSVTKKPVSIVQGFRSILQNHEPAVSPQNENVLFCKVEMSYCPNRERLPFPSVCMVWHRGQPSRLPSGAKTCGLDGTRPR